MDLKQILKINAKFDESGITCAADTS